LFLLLKGLKNHFLPLFMVLRQAGSGLKGSQRRYKSRWIASLRSQ